jgi:hypothetical protein
MLYSNVLVHNFCPGFGILIEHCEEYNTMNKFLPETDVTLRGKVFHPRT